MTEEEANVLVAETEEYAGLVTEANYNRQKFMLFLRSVLLPGVDLQQLADSFSLVCELDNAAGDQLDMIGSLIGIGRLLDYAPAEGDRIMDDDEYRMVLKLTIAQNTWDGALGSLKKIYDDVFGGDVSITYKDNQNMSVVIDVYGDISTRETEILQNSGLLLVPAGVGSSVNVLGGSVTTNGYFAAGVSGLLFMDSCVTT